MEEIIEVQTFFEWGELHTFFSLLSVDSLCYQNKFSFNLLSKSKNKLKNFFFTPRALLFSSGGSLFRQNLTLNLNDSKAAKVKKPFGTLDLHGLSSTGGNLSSRSSAGFSFNVGGFNRLNMALIDDSIPLERQG